MEKLLCLRCGFTWEPRIKNPKSCPSCKRYDWNKRDDGQADDDMGPIGCPKCLRKDNLIIDGPMTGTLNDDYGLTSITFWQCKCGCGYWGVISDGSLDINQ